jgi:hypothetical protein
MTAIDVTQRLREAGFLPWIPEEPSKPDLPTVRVRLDTGELTLLCANQCVRDSRHECGVPTTLDDLLLGGWVLDVCRSTAWMVNSWGAHLHQLPFCCTGCMRQFVDERTQRFEDQRALEHDINDELRGMKGD